MLNKPYKLCKGDTIGIVNPAFCNPEGKDYQKIYDYLESFGYKVKLGKTFTAKEGYLAGSDELRAQDINEMFADDEVKAIICMRGGYGASRMVDKLDYELISKKPKLFMGFSDITVLINNIYKHSNVPAYHGLVGAYLNSDKFTGYTKQDFESVLFENQKGRILKSENDNVITLNGGTAEGILVGGNLSLLATLVGTPYAVDFEEKIVLIEEVSEEPYQIDRYLSSLYLSGGLQKAKGFILGYFTDCNPSESRKNDQSVLDVINHYIVKLNKPTVYNFPIGHSFPTCNLPVGIKVKLDADNKTVEIKEEFYNEF